MNNIQKKSHTYVRAFNRFELKYIIDYKQAKQFVQVISPYVRSDAHAGRGGFYKIVSLYYDSPQLTCYWEKVDGEKYRRKLRIRTYGENSANAFLEIKQRHNLTVQKRRCAAPLEDIESQMHRISNGAYKQGEDPVYDEAFILVRQFGLEPKIVVSYNRAAFFDRHKDDLRITIDRNIKCRHLSLDLSAHHLEGSYVLPPTMMIMEIKFNEMMPPWLCTCLNSMDLQARRMSKYCSSIERAALHKKAISQ